MSGSAGSRVCVNRGHGGEGTGCCLKTETLPTDREGCDGGCGEGVLYPHLSSGEEENGVGMGAPLPWGWRREEIQVLHLAPWCM